MKQAYVTLRLSAIKSLTHFTPSITLHVLYSHPLVGKQKYAVGNVHGYMVYARDGEAVPRDFLDQISGKIVRTFVLKCIIIMR